MSQNTARHDSHAKSRDEDAEDLGPISQNASKAPGYPNQPPDGGVYPDGPGENELELTGDDDLGPADLGPLGPHADPDAGSGRVRKIARENGRDTERRQ